MDAQSKRITLKNVIIHFPNILEPIAIMGDSSKTEYSARIVLPSGHPQIQEFAEAISELQSSLPDGQVSDGRQLLKSYAEDDNKIDFERFPEYLGGYYFKAKTQYKPQLLNPQKQPANDYECQTWMWAGAVVHVSLNLYTWSNKFGKGVSANLRNLMLTGEGKKIESASAASDFDAIEVAESKAPEPVQINKPSSQNADDIINQIKARSNG